MIKTITLLLTLSCFPVALFAQHTISGNVVNKADGTPVAGSSVFLSNTSLGAVSDKDGYFELNDIPPGRYDLVVSSIEYETSVYSFGTAQLPLQLQVQLALKVKELDNVTVEPFVEEGWDKWGNTFLENFIGRSPNALHCSIKNYKIIHFRYYKKSRRLIAYADEPVIIENKALGYIIRYQLEDFEVNYADGSFAYAGFTFFEEIDKDRKGLKRRWQEARDKAYYGSVMHFMRSLYRDSLLQNGFEVRRMVRLPNDEKVRVKRLYAQASKPVYDSVAKIMVIKRDYSLLAQDSMEYYQRILNQKDYTEIYSGAPLTSDSLVIRTEGTEKIIFFTNYLYITYKYGFEDKEYLAFHGENRSPTFQRSYLTLASQQPVSVDMNGNYYPPQELFSSAYWAWSNKNADLLPQDYQPATQMKRQIR